MFSVCFNKTVSGIFKSIGSYTRSNLRDSDVFSGICYGVDYRVILVVGVSKELHAYDVLVALHQGTEPTSRLVLEFSGHDVTDQVGDSSCFLNVLKLVFKP